MSTDKPVTSSPQKQTCTVSTGSLTHTQSCPRESSLKPSDNQQEEQLLEVVADVEPNEGRQKQQHHHHHHSSTYHAKTDSKDDSINKSEPTLVFDWNVVLLELENPDNKHLGGVLRRYCSSGDITNIVDEKGFNLLHHAVLKSVPGKVKCLIDFVRQYALKANNITKEQMLQWINARTKKDEFTPLHFASFKTNLDACDELIKNGADINAINLFSLNMLHVASQGDAAPSLYYFKKLGVELNMPDNRGSTPLHWACYSQSEIALSYILAWDPDMNAQDIEGYTPLHLAVRSVDNLESTRPVRFLLIRGADKDIKDNRGRKPIDLIRDVTNQRLADDLQRLLGDPPRHDCLMLSSPTRKLTKNYSMMITYLSLLCVALILQIFFVFPRSETWQIIVYLTSMVICLIFFAISSQLDPGYLQNKNVDFLDMLKIIDPTQLCPDCNVIRTQRSRHCSVCNRCVERFDHHCPWINNCVGVRNHNFFLGYIIWQLIVLAIAFSQGCQVIINEGRIQHPSLVFGQVQDDSAMFYSMLTILMAIICLFLFPLIFLVFVQTNNFLRGQTTMERYSRGNQNQASTSSMFDPSPVLNAGIQGDFKESMIFQDETEDQVEKVSHHNSKLSESSKEQLLNKNSQFTQDQPSQQQIDMEIRIRNYMLESTDNGSCYKMCFKREIRSQYDIYQSHVRYTKLTETKITESLQSKENRPSVNSSVIDYEDISPEESMQSPAAKGNLDEIQKSSTQM